MTEQYMFTEINIDALVGPTHHFGGLGVGNVASQQHAYRTSRPRDAALEGLRKLPWWPVWAFLSICFYRLLGLG